MKGHVDLPWAQQVWQLHRQPLTPAAALAHMPPPTIDPEDVPTVNDDAQVRIAVLLDVLTTQTRQLPADGTILAQLARISCATAQTPVSPDERPAQLRSLLALASTPAGDVRAQLSLRLAVPTHRGDATSLPDDVIAATRRLEQAAEVLIAEACLLLAARGVMQFRQA